MMKYNVHLQKVMKYIAGALPVLSTHIKDVAKVASSWLKRSS